MKIFKSLREMKDFLSSKIKSTKEEKLEFCIFDNYKKNRLFISAEHAYTHGIPVKRFGKNARLLFGDIYTGWLARLAAFHTKSLYVIPQFPRIHADPTRDPKELGKGIRYLARIKGGTQEKLYTKIHKDKKYLPYLLHYHEFIQKMNPSVIVSVHGMSEEATKGKFDILLGFGKDREYIKGTKTALRFKKELISRLDKEIKLLDGSYQTLDHRISIGLSKKLFTGSKNYILSKYATNPGRIGLHVEFSKVGRKDNIVAEFQLAVQIIAEMMIEYSNKN